MKKHLGRLLRVGFIVFVSTLILTAVVLANQGGESRFVIPGGGGIELEGGEIKFAGAIGQPVAGWVKKSGYTLCSGFWCGGSEVFITNIYLPLAIRNFPLIHQLGDAPNLCNTTSTPRAIDFYPPNLYRDDFGHLYDVDWYTFNAITGNTYTIRTSDVGNSASTVIFVFNAGCPNDATGRNISCEPDLNNPDNQCKANQSYIPGCRCVSNLPKGIPLSIPWTASTTNPVILVREFSWNFGTHTGYTLRVEKTP